MVLKVIKTIPAFVSTNMKEYGPFEVGETIKEGDMPEREFEMVRKQGFVAEKPKNECFIEAMEIAEAVKDVALYAALAQRAAGAEAPEQLRKLFEKKREIEGLLLGFERCIRIGKGVEKVGQIPLKAHEYKEEIGR